MRRFAAAIGAGHPLEWTFPVNVRIPTTVVGRGTYAGDNFASMTDFSVLTASQFPSNGDDHGMIRSHKSFS
jgi:hypothetical protein